jgi:hypothetical protein
MERRQILLPARALILATLLVSGIAVAEDGEPHGPAAPAEALSAAFTYQGQLEKDGSPVNDACDMAFRLYDEAVGGAQVGSAITATVPISDGLFTVSLDFGAGAFDGGRRWLGIAVDCEGDGSYADLGRQELTAAPYALYAMGAPWSGLAGVPAGFADGVDDDTTYSAGEGLVLDGTEFSARGSPYANVVVVAKSGGDYASVHKAIDSITDAAEDNVYLVWVAPGVYEEQVTMKPYVHLQGAGQEATVITSTVSSSWPISQATLVLTRATSLRDLTVGNGGAGALNVALLATAGTTRTLVADVTARALGGGMLNYAVYLTGGGTGVTLQHVTGLAENGSDSNYGLLNGAGAEAALHGGSFTARGGSWAGGINNNGSGTTLDAQGVTALGEEGSSTNCGLLNGGGAEAALHGGSFTARGGTNTYGISNFGSGTTLEAEGVTALGENGSDDNYGLRNYNGAAATLRDDSLTARGGNWAYAIYNDDSGTTLEATGVTALGEGGDYNFGLFNESGAAAVLCGGSLTARGGSQAYAINNNGSGTTLEATDITALGEDGDYNCGLASGAGAVLHGGSLTARGGYDTSGIFNTGSGTTLEAVGVGVLAVNGQVTNYCLENENGAAAALHGGSLTARGGTYAYGIYNDGSGTTLEATGVTVLAENGSDSNWGLYNQTGTAEVDSSRLTGSTYGLYLVSGTVSLGVTQLDGGAVGGGTLTCFEVYDENYASHSCNP